MFRINSPPKDGDIYKTVKIDEHSFELRYGYYEEFERHNGEPVVLYPDLVKNLCYTKDGYRIVTAIQDPCGFYTVSEHKTRDECCNDCDYYKISGNEIGICTCPENRKAKSGSDTE